MNSANSFKTIWFAIWLTVSFAAVDRDGRLAALQLESPRKNTPAISISLYANANIDSKTVRVGDIAKVYCSDKDLAERIQNIDIDEFLADNKPLAIQREQISIRLNLSGIQPGRIRFLGALISRVEFANAAPSGEIADIKKDATENHFNEPVVDAIRNSLAEFYGVSTESVLVMLKTEPKFEVADNVSRDSQSQVRLLTDPAKALGIRTVSIGLISNGRISEQSNVTVETSIEKRIAVSKRAILRGEVFSRDNIELRPRMFQNANLNQFISDEIFGRFASRNVNANTEFRINDIQLAKSTTQSKEVIRANDQVNVVAKSGSIQIRLNGATALQSGRIGDTIRIKNRGSKKILMGKITSPTEVQLIY